MKLWYFGGGGTVFAQEGSRTLGSPGQGDGVSLRARWERTWSVAAFGLFGLLFVASPLAAQRAVSGGAFVQVPAVSELDVEVGGSAESSGVFRIRVRANHPWKVVLTAPVDVGGTVWVRVTGAGEAAYRPLEPGLETVVASGERGAASIEIEYRLEGARASEVTGVPLTYTLGSL